MKKIYWLLLVLLIPLAVSASDYNYETFFEQQFKIHVPIKWKSIEKANFIKIKKKTTTKVFSRIREISLNARGQELLNNQQGKKFANKYKKKLKNQFSKYSPTFVRASKYSFTNYKSIILKYNLKRGKMRAYYITDGVHYYRIITICNKKKCSADNTTFRTMVDSFQYVEDEAVPTFSGLTSVEANSTSSVTLAWSAAEDDVSSVGDFKYNIYEANQLEEQVYTTPTYTTEKGATEYTIDNLTESTVYYYVVRAEDEAGNEEDNTIELIITTAAESNSDPGVSNITTLVNYQSNGSEVEAIIFKPTGDGPFPAIIYNHGGVTAYNPINSAYIVNQLADGGKYVVLGTAYRGDQGSEGELDIAMGDVNDVLAAIEYLKSKDYVDQDRIGVFGLSRGGNVTLSAATRNNIDIKAVVTWFPFVNVLTYCEYLGGSSCIDIFGFDAASEYDDYSHEIRIASPINFTDKLTMPMQNSHSEDDIIVPYSQSEELNTALTDKTDYTFYSYTNQGHGTGSVWATSAQTLVIDFFNDNL